MALVQQVKDGKLVESTSQQSLKKANTTSGGDMDKNSFLKLLTAQMKYQDPLEPTSNTEYIAQYAQFSQVESMTNMASSFDMQRASSLVGQEVYMKVTGSKGETNFVQGKVDYVVYENSKAFLSINEQLYSIEDLDTVVDAKYLAAYNKATDLVTSLVKLPVANLIGKSDFEEIDRLEKIYNEMDEYEKTFVASDMVKKLTSLTEKVKELRETLKEN